jgi:PPM family protein phosphatase
MADTGDVSWRAAVSTPLDVDPFHPTSSALAVELAAASVCGAEREHNTDHYLAVRIGRTQETLATSLAAADLPPRFEEYAYAMVVADGFGTGAAGARASRVALSALAYLAIQYGKWNVRVDADTAVAIADQSDFFFRRVNEAVIKATGENLSLADMATSLTALYIAESDLFFTHIGHSRAFLLRSGILTQLTADHTLQRKRRGASGPSGLGPAKTDRGHVVTDTIGGRRGHPEPDIEHLTLSPGDRLLLCTNGLTDVVSAERIADVLALQRRPRDDCHRLIELARAVGHPDDVTLIVADYRVRRSS